MARTNAARIRPERSELIVLHVLRTRRVSPTFLRVTLGGGDIARFAPLGFDQWFRFFIPVSDESALTRLPAKLDALAYARYLTMAKATRPVLRNYTVQAFRPDGAAGAELDVDFVLHGSAEHATADGASSGPAASWAQSCRPGDAVALLDEGIMFVRDPAVSRVRLVCDETGLPAAGGILVSLGEDVRGAAVIEVPHADDVRTLPTRSQVQIEWAVRDDPHAVPGVLAAERAARLQAPAERCYSWVVGESSMATGLRRRWIAEGSAKSDVTFCGYWKK